VQEALFHWVLSGVWGPGPDLAGPLAAWLGPLPDLDQWKFDIRPNILYKYFDARKLAGWLPW